MSVWFDSGKYNINKIEVYFGKQKQKNKCKKKMQLICQGTNYIEV